MYDLDKPLLERLVSRFENENPGVSFLGFNVESKVILFTEFGSLIQLKVS